jgi:hypothetical protein
MVSMVQRTFASGASCSVHDALCCHLPDRGGSPEDHSIPIRGRMLWLLGTIGEISDVACCTPPILESRWSAKALGLVPA